MYLTLLATALEFGSFNLGWQWHRAGKDQSANSLDETLTQFSIPYIKAVYDLKWCIFPLEPELTICNTPSGFSAYTCFRSAYACALRSK
jgi:hypothetical protein